MTSDYSGTNELNLGRNIWLVRRRNASHGDHDDRPLLPIRSYLI